MSDITQTITGSARSRLALIREATRECLQGLSDAQLRDPDTVEAEVLREVNQAIDLANATGTGDKWKHQQELTASQIADIMYHSYSIINIVTAKDPSSDTGMLAAYQDCGPDEGLYVTNIKWFHRQAKRYHYGLTMREFDEVLSDLRLLAEERTVCDNRDMVAVNNGLFNYKTKILESFDPSLVFLSKSRVNYNPAASNVVIHNADDGTDWDVESWVDELSDDPGVVNLLWQVLGAIIRPLVNWDKSAWFYSESGNNGKGTLCELMRQLCGDGTYTSIPLSDFGKDFMLEPLTHASAIIVDENDVGTYIDKAANLKAVVTGDVIQINRKFKTPISYQFHGFMVQCLNEMPRIKDKSDSFYRRQVFVPFTKCFTGKERKYIKHDYLQRQEVLEYVLYKVLHMDYYELDVPDICRTALEEYKDFVDPIREFLKEYMDQFVWDLLPVAFLYDLYCAWYKQTNSGDRNIKSRPVFIKDLRILVQDLYPDWSFPATSVRPSHRMDAAEPLIAEFHLTNWENPMYKTSSDWEKRCKPALKPNYKGLVRVHNCKCVADDTNDGDSDDDAHIVAGPMA